MNGFAADDPLMQASVLGSNASAGLCLQRRDAQPRAAAPASARGPAQGCALRRAALQPAGPAAHPDPHPHLPPCPCCCPSLPPAIRTLQVSRALVGLIVVAAFPVNHVPARSTALDLLGRHGDGAYAAETLAFCRCLLAGLARGVHARSQGAARRPPGTLPDLPHPPLPRWPCLLQRGHGHRAVGVRPGHHVPAGECSAVGCGAGGLPVGVAAWGGWRSSHQGRRRQEGQPASGMARHPPACLPGAPCAACRLAARRPQCSSSASRVPCCSRQRASRLMRSLQAATAAARGGAAGWRRRARRWGRCA